jgi:hypothetical protein
MRDYLGEVGRASNQIFTAVRGKIENCGYRPFTGPPKPGEEDRRGDAIQYIEVIQTFSK